MLSIRRSLNPNRCAYFTYWTWWFNIKILIIPNNIYSSIFQSPFLSPPTPFFFFGFTAGLLCEMLDKILFISIIFIKRLVVVGGLRARDGVVLVGVDFLEHTMVLRLLSVIGWVFIRFVKLLVCDCKICRGQSVKLQRPFGAHHHGEAGLVGRSQCWLGSPAWGETWHRWSIIQSLSAVNTDDLSRLTAEFMLQGGTRMDWFVPDFAEDKNCEKCFQKRTWPSEAAQEKGFPANYSKLQISRIFWRERYWIFL